MILFDIKYSIANYCELLRIGKMVFMILCDYLQLDLVKYLQNKRHIIAPITPLLDLDLDLDLDYLHYSDALFEKLDKIV